MEKIEYLIDEMNCAPVVAERRETWGKLKAAWRDVLRQADNALIDLDEDLRSGTAGEQEDDRANQRGDLYYSKA